LKAEVKLGRKGASLEANGKGVSLEANEGQIGQTSTSVVMELKADPNTAIVRGENKGSS